METEPGPKRRSFSFNFSLGKKPPIDDPALQELIGETADIVDEPGESATVLLSRAAAVDTTAGERDASHITQMLERAEAIAQASGEVEVSVEIDGIRHEKAFKAGEPGMRQLFDGAREMAKTSSNVKISVASGESGTLERLIDDPLVARHLEGPTADAELSSDGTGSATDVQRFKIEFVDGKLRIGDSDASEDASEPTDPAEDAKKAREREMWERLHRIAEGKGAYPDTQRAYSILSTITWIIAISLPLAALTLALATGQPQETVFFMTIGALIVATMIKSSIR